MDNDYDDAFISRLDFKPEILSQINQWLKNKRDFFVFTGNPGLGKSYMCRAIKKLFKEYECRMFKETQYYSALRSKIENHADYEPEILKISETDFLILDDILTAKMSDWQKEVLFSLIDYRHENRLPMVITSNFTLKQINEIMSAKFVSRLCNKRNLIIEMLGPDRRTGFDYSLPE